MLARLRLPLNCFLLAYFYQVGVAWRAQKLNKESPSWNHRREHIVAKDGFNRGLDPFKLFLLSYTPTVRSRRLTQSSRPVALARHAQHSHATFHQRGTAIPLGSGGSYAHRHSTPKMGVLAIDNNTNFNSRLDSVENIAVVKFFAPWCRTCKKLKPRFEALAEEYEGRATFFEVDFSTHRSLCRDLRMLVLPTIYYYVPNVGCVDRFAWNLRKGNRMAEKLDGLLASDNLVQLRSLNPDVLNPLVRFKQLYGAVQAIRKAPAYLKEKESWLSEKQKDEFKELFRLLDRNGDGQIDEQEFDAVCIALQRAKPDLRECHFAPDELFDVITAADGDDTTHTVDEAAFLRLMAHRAKEDIVKSDTLYDIFGALDTDGNGLITVQGLAAALSGVNDALAENGAALGKVDNAELDALLRAFDLHDESASVNYEEFVSMMAGRGMR